MGQSGSHRGMPTEKLGIAGGQSEWCLSYPQRGGAVNAGLIETLLDAVRGGAVPLPVPGESIDDFRFRTAHAGAMVAIRWITDQSIAAREEAAATAGDSEGRHSDSTVTPLAVVPFEQNEATGV